MTVRRQLAEDYTLIADVTAISHTLVTILCDRRLPHKPVNGCDTTAAKARLSALVKQKMKRPLSMLLETSVKTDVGEKGTYRHHGYLT